MVSYKSWDDQMASSKVSQGWTDFDKHVVEVIPPAF
jgi:hypothetical protein